MRATWLIVPSLAVLLGACARLEVITEIDRDGAATRTLVFTKAKAHSPDLADVFVMPEGEPWKTERDETQEDEVVVRSTRRVPAGAEPSSDVNVHEEGKPVITNWWSVRRIGEDRLEYRETIRLAQPPADPDYVEAIATILREELPEGLLDEKAAKALARDVLSDVFRILFGPPDPRLGLLMAHPDQAERTLRSWTGSSLLQRLEERFGERLPASRRIEVVRRLLVRFDPIEKTKEVRDENEEESSNDMIPLGFVLKAPGEIVETNGIHDPITGEIRWALFPASAAFGEVELRAVVRLPKE